MATGKREQSSWRKKAVGATRETIKLFKAVWEQDAKRSKASHRHDLIETFSCSDHHVLCQPVEPIACSCKRRPVVTPEIVDLSTYPQAMQLVIQPTLEGNQPYLDLLHHSPFHSTASPTGICQPLVITFADVAAAAGNLPLLQHLFTSPQPCVRQFFSSFYSYQNPEGLIMLFTYALNCSCVNTVMYLADKFFEELTSDLKNSILEVSLWMATTDKSLEVCFQQLVLKFGVNGSASSQYCPLYLACLYDDNDAATFLIDHGADMNAWDDRMHSLIYHAYQQGLYTFEQHRVLKTMLAKGLSTEAISVQGSHFRYPIMYTLLSHNQLDLVRLLVSHGHHVNMPMRTLVDDQEHSTSPLMHALACKNIPSAQWLIEQGADVNKPSFFSQQLDDESWTPLHLAVTLGNLSIVQTLIEYGAHADSVTASGETVLSLALDKIATGGDCLKIVSYLIQIGSPVQSIPGLSLLVRSRLEPAVKHNWSLIDLAVYAGDSTSVDLLLKSSHFQGLWPRVSDILQTIMRPESSQQRKATKLVEDYVCKLEVPSLLLQCRNAVRAACGLRLQEYVNKTVMPSAFRSYLLMEDLFGPVDRQGHVEDKVLHSI